MKSRLACFLSLVLLLGCKAGSTDIPEGAHWKASAFPIPVRIDGRIPEARLELVLEAVDKLNDAVPGTLDARVVSRVSPVDLALDLGAIHVQESDLLLRGDETKGLATVLVLPGSKRIVGALVRLRPDVPPRFLFQLASHELGHTLGLRHNPCDGCTMKPKVERGSHFTEAELDYVASQVSGEFVAPPAGDGEPLQITVDQ